MKIFFDFTNINDLLLIIVPVAVVAVGLLLLFLVLKASKKKQVALIEKKYFSTREGLTGQDASLLTRLEKISHFNLKYSDIYEEYLRQFKLMLDGDCKYIEKNIEILKDFLAKKNKDNFRKTMEDTKKALALFKEKAINFDASLRETIQPEENSRINLVKIKEEYRSLKSKYAVSEKNLKIIEDAATKIFEKIDSTFLEFEDLVEKAEYDEANALLPTLEKVISSLSSRIEELPSLCVDIDEIIPNKIKELGEKIKAKEDEGVPTYSLGYNKKVVRWNDELKLLKQSIKNFKFNGAREVLNKIQNEIDNTYKGLDREINDKSYFEKNLPLIFEKVENFNKNYYKFLEKIPNLNEVYVLGVLQLNNLELLKESANELAVAKRGLDNYIQSGIKQSFSGLKNKLDELDAKYQDANTKLDDIKAYIDSIKTDAQNAYDMLYEYYNHLRDIEVKIRAMNFAKYYNERIDIIDTCYNLLNDLNSSLHAKPLNVNKINEDIKDLKNTADPLFNSIEDDYKLMCLAESAIIFNNRDREHQSDVHQKLKVIENRFENCEFDKAYQEASELYKNKHIGE